jgi:hypothetical protein
MSDFVMLICAVLAALASGVLLAYGVCLAFFGLFNSPAPKPAAESVVPVSSPAGILEG